MAKNKIVWSEETFNEKIDSFSKHKDYAQLRKKANRALSSYTSIGLEGIISTDFMDRIIAMPFDYIKDWLEGKNALEWRECDKKMLKAIKGDYVDILKQYPDAEVHRITEPMVSFYEKYGYEIITDVQKRTFAIMKNKMEEQCFDSNK